MLNRNFDEVSGAFEDWLETLSPQEIEDLNALIDGVDECGVQIIEDDEVVDAPKEQEEAVVESKPKAEKVKCKCCGFAKKARRVNAEGICKVCYVALATSGGDEVVVVGRQGRKGRNTVSVVIGGSRVKVQRKVRLES
jgi:DNA segregation ATPase FtsK/SpoIIIE-like protein